QFWRPDLGIWTGEAMIIAAASDYPISLDSTYLYFPFDSSVPPPPGPKLYDLSRDFSPSSNPTAAWSYGYLETLDGPFTLLTFIKSFYSHHGAALAASQVGDSFAPGGSRVMGGSTAVSAGGAFTGPPGTVWFGPGNDGSSRNFGVIRLTVPPGG